MTEAWATRNDAGNWKFRDGLEESRQSAFMVNSLASDSLVCGRVCEGVGFYRVGCEWEGEKNETSDRSDGGDKGGIL